MNYWLMKTEPAVFSIDDLKNNRVEPWDGVRNYQARNFMRDQMQKGDWVLIYHSNANPPGVAGLARVHTEESYPDFTAFDESSKYYDPKSSKDKPRWFLVDVEFIEKFPELLSLAALKEMPELSDMRLLQKGNRLSVMPVDAEEFKVICRQAGSKAFA
jgi:predicted RNA-binding protein with PUA-like domain